MWKLTIEDDEGKRTPLSLGREEYSIGRGEENTVRLTERNISRKHAVLKRNRPRPLLNSFDRLFWGTLRRLCPRWTDFLVIVKPETVIGWHRGGFRRYGALAVATGQRAAGDP